MIARASICARSPSSGDTSAAIATMARHNVFSLFIAMLLSYVCGAPSCHPIADFHTYELATYVCLAYYRYVARPTYDAPTYL